MSLERVAVIAEDDPDVRDLIEIVLAQSGFSIVHAADGLTAIEAVREHNPLLTTLDVNMPGMDGFAVAKRLREFSHTYLIMITALTQEIDIIRGFEAGADDYLVKPFRPRELRARADSMLRRAAFAQGVTTMASLAPVAPPAPAPESWAASAVREFRDEMSPEARQRLDQQYVGRRARQLSADEREQADPDPDPIVAPVPPPSDATPPPQQQPPPTPPAASTPTSSTLTSEAQQPGHVLRFRGITVDPLAGSASLDGRSLGLSEPETQLLSSLIDSGRRVRSKADLVLALRGGHYVTSHFINEADKRAVEAHISGLRRKLNDDEASPKYIETVRGVGYRLAG